MKYSTTKMRRVEEPEPQGRKKRIRTTSDVIKVMKSPRRDFQLKTTFSYRKARIIIANDKKNKHRNNRDHVLTRT